MKVKNRAYIREIAKKILNANKNRKYILLVSIALTCILFTSLFSVALGLVKSTELETMKTIGTVSHGSFKNVSKKDIGFLSKDPDIKEFSIRQKVGSLDNKKVSAELSYVDNKFYDWSLIDKVRGKTPEKEKEVFIDISTAKKLGYKGEIGEKIQIPFIIEKFPNGETLEEKTETFIVSGTFQNPIDSNVGVGQIYLSKAYVDSLNLPAKNNDMEVMLKNPLNIEEKLIKIAESNGYKVIKDSVNLKDKELGIGVNFAYILSGSSSFDKTNLLPVLTLLALVMIAGFLIINNIFKISVNEDIKLIGLLKTIGMTRQQIKKLVHLESLIVALPSIIVGNIAGISMGKVILNKIFSTDILLSNVKLSMPGLVLIILFSSIFTLITVFLSVMKPASYASKISPIEASRFNEVEIKKEYESDSFSLGKLARRQVFANKFRFVSIVLSMSLSAVILNSVLTYTGNIDLGKGLSDVITTDYNLASPKYFRYMYTGEEDSLAGKTIDEIEKQDGFKGGGGLYNYGYKYTYPEIKIEDKKIAPFLFGIDDYLVNKQKFTQGQFDKEKWNSGSYVLIGENDEDKSSYEVGDKLIIDMKDKKKEARVMGKIDYNFSNGLRYYPVIREDNYDDLSPVLEAEYIYLPTSLYKDLTGDMSLMSYGFDVENSEKESFEGLLKSLEEDPDFSYDSRDLQIKSFKDFKNMVEFVGYSLSIVLFLISILNFINIIATEILENMANLSILEAIGMTKGKIKSYLIKKNLIYSLSSLIFSVIVMLLVNKFMLKDLMEDAKRTSFSFVIFPLITVNIVNILVGALFTSKFYKNHSKQPLVDRIRNLE